MMSLSSIIDPLRAANRLSRLPLFDWQIISMDGGPITLTCGIEIKVDGALTKHLAGDMLVVLAGFAQALHAPSNRLAALRASANHFKIVCGVEAGTWLLARTEIINNHHVTTHWEDTENLAYAYPTLDVGNQRFVIDRNIWTSGGASPTLDMMLHYLRTTQNKSLALDVASVFIYIETGAPSDAQSIIAVGRIQQTEPRLAQAIKVMESSIEEPLQVVEIATQIGISVRMLELLCRKHLGVSPGAYYLRLRLQAARRLVLDSNNSILEISVRSGFNSQAALCRAFSKRYAMSPLKLRQSSV